MDVSTLDLFLAIFAAMIMTKAVSHAASWTMMTLAMRRADRMFERGDLAIPRPRIIPGPGPSPIYIPPPPWEGHAERLAELEKKLADLEAKKG